MQKVKLRGRAIRKILAQKNKSQNWLAQRMSITSGHMAQLLNGDRNPSPKVRQKFQEYFKELNFEQLFSFVKQ